MNTGSKQKSFSKEELPLWDLDAVYSGFESQKYREDKESFRKLTHDLLSLIKDDNLRKSNTGKWLGNCIELLNHCGDLYENLESFAYCRYSTNTKDREALREINSLEEARLPLYRAEVLFRNSLAEIEDKLPHTIDSDKDLSEYRFFLQEQLLLQKKQMSPEEEDLAADLSRAGGEAWSRMHEALTSTLSVIWDDKTGERKTVTELRELAHHEDRKIREKAYRLELDAWKSTEIPLAFSLNGVKGFSVILNSRRRYENTLERSVIQSRISRRALDALIGVMESSLPVFRKYLKAKAKLLGLRKLSFYDIFAPVGKAVKKWSFRKASEFIITHFLSFSSELGTLAEEAFEKGWIDARPREGKVGGAYCISFPLAKKSRVLCNFSGTYYSVTTLAHELGHAYHHEVLKDEPFIHRSYPMTLAETASIFAENIVIDKALQSSSQEEKLEILETFLKGATQVIVDILSRFIFEKTIFEERKKGELSADDFCSIMVDAQKKTYGDALDEGQLHPYMWAVKGHYYRQDLAFYNFPYSFGFLFGLGLYSAYRQEGPSFSSRYRDILLKTGKASAIDVTREAGFDIESSTFWQMGIEMVAERIEEYIRGARS
ncbi:MAG: peptidase M3 [Spirochaetes bacterium]|nr:MAG: peptidase M3 [Spirochaetota bacterium]